MNFDRAILSIASSKSKTFMAFCFSFLAGVAIASIAEIRMPFAWLYLGGFFLVALAIAGWQNKSFSFLVLLFFSFLVGIDRYQLAFPGWNDISRLAGREVAVTGYVATEPDVRIDGVRYVVELLPPPRRADARPPLLGQEGRVSGRMYVSTGLYPRYEYGDVLRVHCDLEAPTPIKDKERPGRFFRWDMQMARFGIFAVCRNPYIEKIGKGGGNLVYAWILSFKERVNDRVTVLWHEPHASFMAGLLYGYRGGLGELNDAFARAGVSHILAISGFNISIIVGGLRTLFAYLRIRRQHAFWIIVSGLAVFAVFTGASASVVRAAIFGSLILLATQVGRRARPLHLLVPAAALMVAVNPLILAWDVGFQLSVLATFGIMAIPPVFAGMLERFSRWRFAWEPAIVAVSALALTTPLILYQFGRLPLYALISNLLVVWAVPWIMLAGFVAIAASFIWHPLAIALSLIAFLGMKCIIGIVALVSSLPFSGAIVPLSWWGMAIMYCIIWLGFRRLRRIPSPL